MLRASIRPVLFGALLIAVSAAAPAASQAKAPAAKPQVNARALAVSDFLKRVDDYVALHRKAEDTLPKLSKQTNPQEIDGHERAMARLVEDARKNAKQGDILTPATQRFIRTVLRPIFSGKEGVQIKNEILDKEYKGSVKLVVNGRYPDDVPISTMPPQVLAALPKLPEELEYRFIQNNLIVFDSHAHLIADFMAGAFN